MGKSGAAPAGAMRYRLGERVHAARATCPYVHGPSDPAWRTLRVFAVDPIQPRGQGAVAVLRVPWEPLAPGPAGALFDVDAHDAVAGIDYLPADLEAPRALMEHGLTPAVDDPRFHHQMVYAVASSVYAAFTRALGRHPAFAIPARSDGRARLRLRPHGAPGMAAWYDRQRGEVVFGYAPGRDGFVFSCLAHDVVAHEVCHALVDGLRARFDLPTNPDVLALHEALADLVALFQRLECTELVASSLARTGASLRHAATLAHIARQAGQARRQSALRSALEASDSRPRQYEPALPPHALGGVLVAAVFDAFTTVFERKAAPYLRLAPSAPPLGALPWELPAILSRECAGLARQFLTMCVRALDYCPPADVEFGEFLRAVITADRDLVPDDPWRYRDAWIDAFARRGIRATGVAASAGDEALAWSGPDAALPRVDALRFSALRFDGDPAQAAGADEVARQAHAVGALVCGGGPSRFGLAVPGPTGGGAVADLPVVESVRPLRREGPDGLTRFDVVAEVTQQVVVSGDAGAVPLVGGCTIVIGPDGDVRFVIRKGVGNAARLAERVKFVQHAGQRFWRRSGQQWRPRPALLRALDAQD